MANFQGILAKGVPHQPAIILPIRIAVMVLSVIILAVSAYNLSLFGGYGSFIASTGPAGFAIFCSIKTLLTHSLLLFLENKSPQTYPRLLPLLLYALSLIFWLSSWTWSASHAALFLNTTCTSLLGTEICTAPTDEGRKYGATLAVDAGLGALVWVAVIFLSVRFVLACLRDPDAGHVVEIVDVPHSSPSGSRAGGKAESQQPYVAQSEVAGGQYGPQATPYGPQTGSYGAH